MKEAELRETPNCRTTIFLYILSMFDNLKGDLVFSVCLYKIVASLGFFSSTGKTEEKALKSTVFFEINKAFFFFK